MSRDRIRAAGLTVAEIASELRSMGHRVSADTIRNWTFGRDLAGKAACRTAEEIIDRHERDSYAGPRCQDIVDELQDIPHLSPQDRKTVYRAMVVLMRHADEPAEM